MKRNVYDFDGTIYPSQSCVDFYFYCLNKNSNIFMYLITGAKLFFFGMIAHELGYKKFRVNNKLCTFLKYLPNLDQLLVEFWSKNKEKITWYLEQNKNTDVIISVSPRFLIEPAIEILGVKNLICTEVNTNSCNIIGREIDLNKNCIIGSVCSGAEKAIRFREKFPDDSIDNFYTDSYRDQPLIDLSENAYLRDKKGKKLQKVRFIKVK